MKTNDRLDLKILSIDFDFFQEVDEYTLVANYPDGVDTPPALSSLVWVGHYASEPFGSTPLLEAVQLNKKLYDDIVHIIQNQSDSTIPIYICCSHRHIYDVIISRYPKYRDNFNGRLIIDHIDMHHDFENGNEEVDCGNWVGKTLEKFPKAQIRWFTRKVGEIYYISKKKIKPFAYDLCPILNEQYDVIFLCRSDAWLPPHLDIWFDKLIQDISEIFDENIFIEDSVSEPRNIASILSNAEKERKFRQEQCEKQKKDDVNADCNSA